MKRKLLIALCLVLGGCVLVGCAAVTAEGPGPALGARGPRKAAGIEGQRTTLFIPVAVREAPGQQEPRVTVPAPTPTATPQLEIRDVSWGFDWMDYRVCAVLRNTTEQQLRLRSVTAHLFDAQGQEMAALTGTLDSGVAFPVLDPGQDTPIELLRDNGFATSIKSVRLDVSVQPSSGQVHELEIVNWYSEPSCVSFDFCWLIFHVQVRNPTEQTVPKSRVAMAIYNREPAYLARVMVRDLPSLGPGQDATAHFEPGIRWMNGPQYRFTFWARSIP